MKKVLRSFIVIAVALAVSATSSVAYFTSQVQATNNLIQTGTLRLAIDSTAFGGGNSGYVVAYDNNGVLNQLATLPTITNMQPGETRSVYMTVRNIGTLAFDYRAFLDEGNWGGNVGLNNQNVMSIAGVSRYAANNCQANIECEDIYYWLTGSGFSHVGALTSFGPMGVIDADGTNYFGHADALSDGVNTLLPNQFAIFKVDIAMNVNAGNDFQGQTFTYTVNADAKQTNAPAF